MEAIKPIYTGVFFTTHEGLDLHMTYDFNPKDGPKYPTKIKYADTQKVIATGIMNMGGIIAYKCHFKSEFTGKEYNTQYKSDTPLHITIHCGMKYKPVKAGILMKNLNVVEGKLNEDYVSNYRTLLPTIELIGYWGDYRKIKSLDQVPSIQ